MSDDGDPREPPDALAPANDADALERAAKPRRHYHVALTAAEVLERLTEQDGVKAYAKDQVPDLGGAIIEADYTLELGTREFSLHVGPPAARGQSATGMHRLLYLRGKLVSTRQGTLIELGFAHKRPRWALQRWIGFLALASLGLLWVLMGPEIGKKALLYGALLLVLAPVVVDDVRRKGQIEAQRRDLLNLLEHSFGAIQLDDPQADAPYRRRSLEAGDEDEEDEEEP